jgi:hypothetical protein
MVGARVRTSTEAYVLPRRANPVSQPVPALDGRRTPLTFKTLETIY